MTDSGNDEAPRRSRVLGVELLRRGGPPALASQLRGVLLTGDPKDANAVRERARVALAAPGAPILHAVDGKAGYQEVAAFFRALLLRRGFSKAEVTKMAALGARPAPPNPGNKSARAKWFVDVRLIEALHRAWRASRSAMMIDSPSAPPDLRRQALGELQDDLIVLGCLWREMDLLGELEVAARAANSKRRRQTAAEKRLGDINRQRAKAAAKRWARLHEIIEERHAADPTISDADLIASSAAAFVAATTDGRIDCRPKDEDTFKDPPKVRRAAKTFVRRRHAAGWA